MGLRSGHLAMAQAFHMMELTQSYKIINKIHRSPGQALARGQQPEVHPRGREAQRPGGRGEGHVPPHVLRDAWHVVLRGLLQEGGHRLGVGAPHRSVLNLNLVCF